MNAKKAKRLRREAEDLCNGAPMRKQLTKTHRIKVKDRNTGETAIVERLQVLNDPQFVRGVYRALKVRKP